MYIVIKRDKAEHLKEKMHMVKEIVHDVLDCLDEAADYRNSDISHDYSRHGGRELSEPRSHNDYPMTPDYDRSYHEMSRRRGGRYR